MALSPKRREDMVDSALGLGRAVYQHAFMRYLAVTAKPPARH